MSRKETTLYAYWSKREKDIMFCYPRKADGALLHYHFGSHIISNNPFEVSKTLLQELESRGYDVTTLKFSVKLKKASPPKPAKDGPSSKADGSES